MQSISVFLQTEQLLEKTSGVGAGSEQSHGQRQIFFLIETIMRNEARNVLELEISSWIRCAVRYAPPITLVLHITQCQVLCNGNTQHPR